MTRETSQDPPSTTAATLGTSEGAELDDVTLLNAEKADVTAAEADAADKAVGGPTARADYDVSGSGIKIGILSDSFNVLGGEASAISNGLLPPAEDIHIIKEGPAGSTDEGQAMAEIVHATAPGAQIYFYTAFDSEQDFANGINTLRADGCQVIVDDTIYDNEPMFQVAGPVDTAVQNAVAAGVDYFTAVGNEDASFYQAAFAPKMTEMTAFGGYEDAQIFSNGTPYQTVTIPGDYEVTLALDWSAPYDSATTDSITVAALVNNAVVATSVQSGEEPVVTLDFPLEAADTTYSIVILHNAGTSTPSEIKYILEGGGTIDDPDAGIGSGSAIGQALVSSANAVGAVNVADTPAEGGSIAAEPFSGTGPGELLYAADGAALSSPETLSVPAFLAPDGAPTSIFDPFDGTSAAAPVAAATAALMLQARSTLTTSDVTALLDDSAIPAGASSVVGAGLIQASLAVQYASTEDISGSEQPVVLGTSLGGTIQGAGATQEIIAGSGATLVKTQGTETVAAGAGADTVNLAGTAALLYGNTGSLLVNAQSGSNLVVADTGQVQLAITGGNTEFFNGSGAATVSGGPGADTLVGGTGSMTLLGGTGTPLAFGGTGGNNLLYAGAGDSTLLGGGANDTVVGAGSGDLLYASSSGNDTLLGGTGTEILVGGSAGTDVFDVGKSDALVAPLGSTAVITLGSGESTILMGSGAALVQAVNGEVGGLDFIYDFTSQDTLLLSGYGANAAAQVVASQYDVNGGSWLTLSDGTVIAFVGVSHLTASSVTST